MKRNSFGLVVVVLMVASTFCMAGEIRIRAVSLQPGYPVGEVFVQDMDGKEKISEIEVKSFLNHESQTLSFKSDALVFTKGGEEVKEGDDGNVLGRIEVPDKLRSGILLFLPGLKDAAPKVVITADSAPVFPAGSTKVVNLTADPMKIELEGEAFECEPESEILIKDPPVKKNNSSGMRAFQKKGDEWVQVKTGVWQHPGTKRVLQVISINALTKQVEFRGVRDISDAME